MSECRLRELFGVFFRIGLFTFGGGAAMIPLMRQELCDRRGWMGEADFLETIALAQCAPGPIAGNLAVLLGYRLRRWAGAATTLLGVALPAFLVILFIAWGYEDFREQAWAEKIFAGLRPAVLVLIGGAALRFGRLALRTTVDWAVYGVSLAGLVLFGLHPVLVIVGAALFALGGAVRAGRRGPPEEEADPTDVAGAAV